MRNSAMISGVRPREARYSRACAASGLAQLLLKEDAGALVNVDQSAALFRLRAPPPARSSCIFGIGMLSFSAIRRTASGKVMFSIFCTKLKTSPEAPQPKQWKNWPRGVHRERRRLFLMKRAQPLKVLRAALAQLDVLAHNADDVGLLLERSLRSRRGSPLEQCPRPGVAPQAVSIVMLWIPCGSPQNPVEDGGFIGTPSYDCIGCRQVTMERLFTE